MDLAAASSNLFLDQAPLPEAIRDSLAKLDRSQEQLEFLLITVESNRFTDPGLAYTAARLVDSIALHHRQDRARAKALFWQSWLYIRSNPYPGLVDQSQSNLNIALDIFQRSKDTDWLIRTYDLIASLFFYKDEFTQADSVIDKAFSQLSEDRDRAFAEPYLRAILCQTKGSILYAFEDSLRRVQAHEYFEESLSLYQRTNDSLGIAESTLRLTHWATAAEQDSMFRNSIAIYEQLGYQQDLKEALLDYGHFFLQQYARQPTDAKFDQGLAILQRALRTGDVENCDTYSTIGKLFHYRTYFQSRAKLPTTGLVDSAFQAYLRAIPKAYREGDADCLAKVIKELGKICDELDKGCRTALRDAAVTYDSLLQRQRDWVVQAENQIQLYRMRQQASESKQTLNRNRIVLGGLLGLLLLVVVILYQRKNISTLKKIMKAEQMAYRLQINPHFFSNALEAIESLVNTQKSQEASRYLVKFARLARTVMESSDDEWIPLQQELITLKDYLSLENLRMEDRLDFDINVEPSIDPMEVMIPPMLLQPILENAVKHGIRPKNGGRITVQFMVEEGQRLVCLIEDDGIGINKSRDLREQSVQFRPSRGIQITERRINTMGGSLEISDLQELSIDKTGTVVTVLLPLKNFTSHEHENHQND